MSKFEDHLWREFERHHGHELEPGTPPTVKRRRARPRVLAGTTLGLAGVGAALALVLGAAGTSPAFAVTPNHDGTVTVKILRGAGIAAANARLTALGVRVRVVQIEDGCVAASTLTPRSTPVKPGAIKTWTRVQTRIDPGKIPAGRTLMIVALRAGRRIVVAPGGAVTGAPPVCLPPIPPNCPSPVAGTSGNSGNGGNSGSSGNSGNSASSGNSGSGPHPVGNGALTPVQVKSCPNWQSGPPPSGNSGNSGNS
jgi:hypothetical protein